MKIRDSVVLITGGASGLGGATAQHLAKLGAKVVIADLNEAGGKALASALGGQFARCDVTSANDAQAAVALAMKEFGALHGLANCAGIGTPAKVLGKEGPL